MMTVHTASVSGSNIEITFSGPPKIRRQKFLPSYYLYGFVAVMLFQINKSSLALFDYDCLLGKIHLAVG